jgi:hypothetical protein
MQMRHQWLLLIFSIVVFSPFSAQAGNCSEARASLKAYLTALPIEAYLCDSASDCHPYFLSASSCDAPMILGQQGDVYVGHAMPGLIMLQKKVRASCPAEEHACAPITTNFQCINNVCTVLNQSAAPVQPDNPEIPPRPTLQQEKLMEPAIELPEQQQEQPVPQAEPQDNIQLHRGLLQNQLR